MSWEQLRELLLALLALDLEAGVRASRDVRAMTREEGWRGSPKSSSDSAAPTRKSSSGLSGQLWPLLRAVEN